MDIINKIEFDRNTKKQAYLKVADTGTLLPATVISGKEKGPTLSFTAGIHGAEYPGIAALMEISAELNPQEVKGNLVMVHCTNPSGFANKCPAIVYEDKENLNRMFPGNPEGKLSEKIAHTITNEVQLIADFYIDLHSGDLHEHLTPYVYCPNNCDAEVHKKALEAVKVLDVPYIVKSMALTGAYNSAAVKGVPSMLIERGSRGIWTREEVDAYKKDIYSLLRYFNVLEGEAQQRDKIIFDNVFYPEADIEGCWFPAVSLEEKISKGQLIGTVKDLFGNEIQSYYAESDGIVLYQTSSLALKKGDILVAYGEI